MAIPEKDQITTMAEELSSTHPPIRQTPPSHIQMPIDEKNFFNATISPALSSPSRVASPPLYGDKFDRVYRPIVRGQSMRKRGTQTFGDILIQEQARSPDPSTPSDQKYSYIHAEQPIPPKVLSNRPSNILLALFDLVYLIVPLIFVCYGILAAALHNKPTNINFLDKDGDNIFWKTHWGDTMLIIQNFVPTLFPMAFGVTFVYLIKAFALWRAQHGTRLGFLEQLMGSLSLGGSFVTMAGLQIFNMVGVVLIVLWLLAPIGSQAGLRMIDNNGTLTNTSDVYFMSTDGVPNGLEAEDSDYQYYTYAVNSVYSTSIITPTAQMGPQDPWANVKIPSLEWLERQNGCGADGWCSYDLARARAVSRGNKNLKITAGTYVGMTGVPVVGGNFGLGYQEFVMDLSYFVVNTSRIDVFNQTTQLYSTLPNRNATYDTLPDSKIWNSATSSHPNTFFVDTDTPLSGLGDRAGDARRTGVDMPPRNLYFGSRMHNTTAVANATLWTSFVQAEVRCNFTTSMWNLDHTSSSKTAHGACYISRVRRSPIQTKLSPYTVLDRTWRIAQRLFDNWPDATGPVPFNSSSATEKFINGTVNTSDSPILVATDWLGFRSAATSPTGDNYVDISALDVTTFSERFQLLFNTYWHCYCNLQALTQTEIGLGLGGIMPVNAMFQSTSSTMQLGGQYYRVHYTFWALYMVAALVGLAAGVIALFLKYNTIAPDVFGSVSMWVKENPYTPTPAGGSSLDGYSYSQRVMNMPVKFLDVKPHEPTGHIVLTSMETSYFDDQSTNLRKERFYR